MTNMAGGLISGVETLMLEVDCPDARLVISQSLLEKLAAPAMKAWQKARGTTLEYTVHAAGLMGLGVRGGQYALQTRIASTPVVDAVVKVLEVHHSMANPWEQQVKFEVRWQELEDAERVVRLQSTSGEEVREFPVHGLAGALAVHREYNKGDLLNDLMLQEYATGLAQARVPDAVLRVGTRIWPLEAGHVWREFVYAPVEGNVQPPPDRILVRIAEWENPHLLDLHPVLRVRFAWKVVGP